MDAEGQIILRIPHLTMTILEHHIRHGKLFVVHLVYLLLSVLEAVIQVILFVIFKIWIIGAIAACIALGSAGTDYNGVLCILIFRPVSLRSKGKLGNKIIVIFPFVTQAVGGFHHAVNEQIAGKFPGITGSCNPPEGFIRRVMDPFHAGTDILHRIPVNQFLHIGYGQPPVTVNRLIAHSCINIIIPAASYRTDMIQIIKILKNSHKTGNSSFHRSFIDDTCLRNGILRHCLGIVGYHNRQRPSDNHLFLFPFPGEITLHLTIYHFTLFNYLKARFLTLRFCFTFRFLCLRGSCRRFFYHRFLLFAAGSQRQCHNHNRCKRPYCFFPFHHSFSFFRLKT